MPSFESQEATINEIQGQRSLQTADDMTDTTNTSQIIEEDTDSPFNQTDWDWNSTEYWNYSDAPSYAPSTGQPSALPSSAPSSAPTANIEKFVNSNDAKIIAETFRIYGSLYLVLFFSFCFLRRRYPRYFNIRSWVPELKTELATNTQYGFFSWAWKVFYISDDDLLDNCGMDAMCFLRCLRLGSKLTMMGTINSLWLIPLYLTAEEAEETERLSDPFVLMSMANVPNNSPRAIGTVIAIYITILTAMYLISKEYDWYINYRHKYLSQRKPRNYAIYVSGIPADIQSSYALADYFRQSTSWSETVYEAHIAMEIPSLEAKVAKRDKLVEKIEHVMALERKKGVTRTHHSVKILKGEGVKKVESVRTYMKKLEILNSKITLEAGRITRSNHRMRQHLMRSSTLRNISEMQVDNQGSGDFSEEDGTDNDIDNNERPDLGVGISVPTLATQATSFSSMRGLDDPEGPFSRIDYCGDIEEGSVFSLNDSITNSNGDACKQLSSETSKYASITEPSTDESRTLSPCPLSEKHRSEQMDVPHPFLTMLGLNPSLFNQSTLNLRDNEDTLNSLSVETPDKVYEDNFDESLVDFSEQDEDVNSLADDCLPKNLDSENKEVEKSEPEESSDVSHEDLNMDKSDAVEGKSQMSGGSSWIGNPKKFSKVSSSCKSTWFLGDTIRSNAASVRDSVKMGAQKVGTSTVHVSNTVKKVGKASASTVKAAGTLGVTGIKKAADFGIQKIQEAPDLAVDLGANIGAQLAASASAVVPLRLGRTEGNARDAGFVVFRDLYTTQASRQMLQHHVGECVIRHTSLLLQYL